MARRGEGSNPITGAGYDDTPTYGRRSRPESGRGPSISPIVTDDAPVGRAPAYRGQGSAGSIRGGIAASQADGYGGGGGWRGEAAGGDRGGGRGDVAHGSRSTVGPSAAEIMYGGYSAAPAPAPYRAEPAPYRHDSGRDILDDFAARAGIPGPALPLPRVNSFGSDRSGSAPRSPTTMGALHLHARRDAGAICASVPVPGGCVCACLLMLVCVSVLVPGSGHVRVPVCLLISSCELASVGFCACLLSMCVCASVFFSC